ncbi:MAG TPA: hypothetical protein VKZ44_09685 [Taishania sp.]|nr:hypothetical protein [Taishania sp.]
MKPSTELFKLIKSLSKSEKRFFKLTSSLQSGDKNYVKIFDSIDAQVEYDEEGLKEQFKDEKFIKHLSSEKNHLYKLILKSLRSYYSEDSVTSILKQEIKNIEILFNKALYKECEKFIIRAKKIAEESEKFYYWSEIISWEKKLIEEGLQENFSNERLKSLVQEEEMVIQKLRNLAEYHIIYSKINNIFRSGGFIRSEQEEKEVEEIADHHLIKDKNTALSIRASSICYYIKGLCAATNRNFADSYLFFNKTKEILDSNVIIKADLNTRYVQTLSFLLRCYIDGEQFDKASGLIVELKKLSSTKGFNNVNTEVRIHSNAYQMELLMLQRQGKFQEAIRVIHKLDEFVKEHEEILSKEQIVLFTYYKCVTYFAIGELKKSLALINNVLNDNEQMIRKDIYGFARIFNLILHYELGNYDFTDYVIKSINRYLSKQDRASATEHLLIKGIRKLSKNIKEEEVLTVLQEMTKEFQAMKTDRREGVILEYFNLEAWLQSKLNKTSYAVEIQQLLKTNSSTNIN